MKNLLKALAAAIAEMPKPTRNATNPHLKKGYADLSEVMACVSEPLAKHGLVLTQTMTYDDTVTHTILVTTLWHTESAESLESSLPLLLEKVTAQGQGSAISYARRYSVKSLFGMVDDDDDGNEASKPQRRAEAKPAAEPPRDLTTTEASLLLAIKEANDADALHAIAAKIGAMKTDEIVKAKLRVAFAKRRSELSEPEPES